MIIVFRAAQPDYRKLLLMTVCIFVQPLLEPRYGSVISLLRLEPVQERVVMKTPREQPLSYSLALSITVILPLTTLFPAGLAGCRSVVVPEQTESTGDNMEIASTGSVGAQRSFRL
ncbi:unnamed protein product [Pleuronectes platessa]|uniref:Uncharacterized protein n=1 Tax=Pleuronectes platessa TaxID=8262 RepID=A0A9N7TRU1_PLEPL|nr:unnamed protein product [Pleuronectes platessa]